MCKSDCITKHMTNRMKQIISFAALVLIAISCTPVGVEVEVTNRSDRPMDSIRVATSTKTSEVVFVRLNGGETQTRFLNMEDEPAADGKFVVMYRHGSSTFHVPISRFSNGMPPDKKVAILVAPNGVSVKH
jgi:hypothetical protein